jgi:hypothetical protein
MTTDTLYVRALQEGCHVSRGTVLRGSYVRNRTLPRVRAQIEQQPVVTATAGFKVLVFDDGLRDRTQPVREIVCGAEWEAWHALMQFEFSENPLGEVGK